jgi:ketosteroid isomerase-like protein
MSAGNIAFVQTQYAAFGRGDTDSIVASCAPDVVWQVKGRPGEYPMIGTWKGKDGVRAFFQLLGETEEPIAFEPREFHAAGNLVFALGQYEFGIRKTGKRVACEWVHVFKVENGKLVAFSEFTDTAQFAAAWR